MERTNYVARAWEHRFSLHRKRTSSERFAIGFALGALITALTFFYVDVAIASAVF